MASAQSRVELIVEAAKAINPLRRVQAESKKVDQALKRNNRAARDVEAAFQRMGRTGIRSLRDLESNARRLGRTMGGLRGTIGKAVLGFAAFKSIQGGIERIESERKLRLLSREFGEIAAVQQAASRAAQRFGLSQTEANQALGKIYARLRPVGIGLADIESTFNGFNTAAKLAGATAGESAGAFLQLSQALGSGYLRGQELNSVLEQAPLIGIAIAKEMGVAVGELKDLGAEGKITSATVIKALKRIETEGADKLKEAMGGPGQAVKDFQNSVEDLQVAVTKDAMPALTTAFKELAIVIRELAPALRFIGQVAAQVFSYIGGLARRVNDMLSGSKRAQAEIQASAQGQKLTRERFGVLGMLSPEAQAFRKQVEKNFMFNFDAQQRMKLEAAAGAGALPALPSQPLPSGGGGGGGRAKSKGKGKRIKDFTDFAVSGLDPAIAAEEAFGKQVEELAKGNMLLEARLAGGYEEEAQRQRINELIEEAGFTDTERINQARATLETIFAQTDALKEQERINKENKRLFESIGSAIKDGIVDSIMSAIDGTKSLGESLSGILKQLAGMFLQAGIGGLGQALKIPGFANGGTIRGGQPAIVGERGPELFMPGRSGSIVPNNALGGANIVVNVDAKGTQAQGNQPNSAALGRAIGAAVQAELIKQKRPGGLLA